MASDGHGGSSDQRGERRDAQAGPARGPGRQYFVPAPDKGSRPKAAPTGVPGGSRAPFSEAESKRPGGIPPRRSTGTAVPPRTHHRKRKRWLLLIPLALVGLLVFVGLRTAMVYNKIQRVDLEGVLSPAASGATNYLLVGSDSRAEFDPEGASGVTGSRADTIIVLRLSDSGSKMMSIPRDLWVTVADTGKGGRINGSYNRGPANLVRTVTENLDIPVNHYVEVGFGSFAGLVDALGGVPIEFAHPAFDKQSGLNITEAGIQTLNGEQALAYARSRHYVEIIDGREVKDPTADLGRQQRQQTFLRSALGEMGKSKNPFRLLSAADAMSGELRVDQGLGMMDMFSLARKLGASSPETVVLPTVNARKGRAAVLLLKKPDALGVLDGFR